MPDILSTTNFPWILHSKGIQDLSFFFYKIFRDTIKRFFLFNKKIIKIHLIQFFEKTKTLIKLFQIEDAHRTPPWVTQDTS